MIRLHAFVCSTRRNPSRSWSTSMKSYGTWCSPKNFLARLQSWHQVVPYIVMLFAGMVVSLCWRLRPSRSRNVLGRRLVLRAYAQVENTSQGSRQDEAALAPAFSIGVLGAVEV